jgi:energy-coupling factor transporter ATP-binding protein EcfA2
VLKSLRLQNFRGFTDHVVEFAPFTLLIGQNNAGKTTIIEALRIIAVAQARMKSAKFIMASEEYSTYFSGPVFLFSLKTIDFDEENIHYNYNIETPAIITARFKNNCNISVYLGRESSERYCQFQEAGGKRVNSRTIGLNPKFHRVFVMPPIGSLLSSETEREKRYLRENINGYLSYRHIRNQMYDMPDEFSRFCIKLEETWDHLHVEGLLPGQGELRNEYHLNLRDGRYPAEVARVGSGLQAWIQTLWFLSRVDETAIVVLDEPDVYLHADLQKKLIRVLAASNFRQTIVATHSVEMIADVSPDEIVDVRKAEARSKAISSTAEAQAILYQMGTTHHLQLSKLGVGGKVLFLEGKDHQLLGQVASKLGYDLSRRFEAIPRFPIGGMSNWKRAAMTAQVLFDTSGGCVKSMLIIDRDYFDDEYLDAVVAEAAKSQLDVRYWDRKEIENYFLDAGAIWEHVQRNSAKKVDREDIEARLDAIVADLATQLPAQIGQQIQLTNKKLDVPKVLERAEKFIEYRKSQGATDADLVSGKSVFSALSAACQDSYGVSFSATTICRSLDARLVPERVTEVIKALCPA